MTRRFLRLADHALLRRLETPSLYDRNADELYELNEEGFAALARCDGTVTEAGAALEPAFQAYCLSEGLLVWEDTQARRVLPATSPAPLPSLRYLELQITWRCNLACRHCYLGPARPVDLSVADIARVCGAFEEMGGLRLLVSGGEPLAHPEWGAVNEILAGLCVRRVLLTNGLLLDDAALKGLACDEVQLSLDGMRAGHEALRGPGTFDRAVAAARRARDAGLALSIATQAHRGNLGELEALAGLARELGADAWSVDAPCAEGRLAGNPGLAVTAAQAAGAMALGFGGAYHGGRDGMACGLHLATVGAQGLVAQCGFYFDRPLGRVEEGLAACWARRRPVPLSDLPACAACPAARDCGGGCRHRAPGPGLPDPVLCALHGIDPSAYSMDQM